MKAITISSLRNRIKHYFNLVTDSSEVLIITKPGKEDAVVILSLREYSALTETHYLLSSESNRVRLMESILQAQQLKGIPYEPDTDAVE